MKDILQFKALLLYLLKETRQLKHKSRVDPSAIFQENHEPSEFFRISVEKCEPGTPIFSLKEKPEVVGLVYEKHQKDDGTVVLSLCGDKDVSKEYKSTDLVYTCCP